MSGAGLSSPLPGRPHTPPFGFVLAAPRAIHPPDPPPQMWPDPKTEIPTPFLPRFHAGHPSARGIRGERRRRRAWVPPPRSTSADSRGRGERGSAGCGGPLTGGRRWGGSHGKTPPRGSGRGRGRESGEGRCPPPSTHPCRVAASPCRRGRVESWHFPPLSRRARVARPGPPQRSAPRRGAHSARRGGAGGAAPPRHCGAWSPRFAPAGGGLASLATAAEPVPRLYRVLG